MDPRLHEEKESIFLSTQDTLFLSAGTCVGISWNILSSYPFPSLDYGDFLEAGHNEACFNPGPATRQLCYLAGPQLPLAQFLHHLT